MTIKSDKVTDEIDRYLHAMQERNKRPSEVALTQRQFDDLNKDIKERREYRGVKIRVFKD